MRKSKINQISLAVMLALTPVSYTHLDVYKRQELANASTLKLEVVAGLDIMIVRELTGDVYFGQPRGMRTNENGEREGFNTMVYSESEVRRIAHVAFGIAMKRRKNGQKAKLCSVDKANVLETTEFWKEIVIDVAKEYPEVELSHMYVDNAAMQLIRNPKQFDVMVTGNIFGDILSDEASMLTGSIGMLASASLNATKKGLYEPSHGSAPVSYTHLDVYKRQLFSLHFQYVALPPRYQKCSATSWQLKEWLRLD